MDSVLINIRPGDGSCSSLIFYACLKLRLNDVETYWAPGLWFLIFAEYSAVICGACIGTLVTLPWLCCSMIYCCALIFLSEICIMYWSCWFLDVVHPIILCRDDMSRARGMSAYVGAFANRNLRVDAAKLCYLGFVVPDRTSILCFQFFLQP